LIPLAIGKLENRKHKRFFCHPPSYRHTSSQTLKPALTCFGNRVLHAAGPASTPRGRFDSLGNREARNRKHKRFFCHPPSYHHTSPQTLKPALTCFGNQVLRAAGPASTPRGRFDSFGNQEARNRKHKRFFCHPPSYRHTSPQTLKPTLTCFWQSGPSCRWSRLDPERPI
jgi:hypothetical protein